MVSSFTPSARATTMAALGILGAVTTTAINALTVAPVHRTNEVATELVALVLSGVAA